MVAVCPEQGSTLRYGDFVINTISDVEPLHTCSQRGDIVNISMDTVSGDLDPYLQVVDSKVRRCWRPTTMFPVPSSPDAEISSLVIQQDGVYVIIASRYGQAAGGSTGTFVLTLNTAQNSGLGNTPQTAQQLLVGDVVENEITAQRVARYYYFDAAQNDIVSIRLTRLGSSLDPLLILTDSDLNPLVENDDAETGQTVNSAINNYLIPATGRYYIIATRYQREQGTTSGRFRLEFQGQGNAFDSVAGDVGRITYGTTVTGFIDDLSPELRWAFWGTAGDAITVSMTRGDGNLDAVVRILNDLEEQLVSDDDSGNEQDARIDRYVLPRTGVYYLIATRYSGAEGDAHTSGSFTLVLARRFN
ncbi:MAG: PPC domain-containing protein [Anaerolineae bacterium]